MRAFAVDCTAIAIASLSVTAVPCQADIVVATAGPMTGWYAPFGEQMRKGIEMAVADINAAGGLLGQRLKLEVGDDGCDAKQAVAVANQLARAGAKFVAGHFCSSSSIPASQVYNQEGILQITPASTNPKLTEQGLSNVFRVCGRDDQQGAVAARYIIRNYSGKRIAILHDGTAYGKGLADSAKQALNQSGLNERLYQAYNPGSSEYSALASRMRQESIDVVYIGGIQNDAGMIAKQSRNSGLNAAIVSGDAVTNNEYLNVAGSAGLGTTMTFMRDPRETAGAGDYVEKFRRAGFEPEGYTLYTYAALQVWAQAVAQSGSTDLSRVSRAIRSGRFPTAIGTIDFDDKGDLTAPPYVLYRWGSGGSVIQVPNQCNTDACKDCKCEGCCPKN